MSGATLREGAERLVDPIVPAQNAGLGLDPNADVTLEREAPPPVSEAPQTFTRESIADGMDDNEFLMNRLGMASTAPPPQQQPQRFLAPPPSQTSAAPTLSEKEIYAKKVEYLWILRRLRGSDPNFPIPKITDDLYKIEMLVEQVRRENACADGVQSMQFGLMFFSGALENVASKPPFNRWLHLKGYSKKLMMDIESDRRFEECFVQLSQKYREKMPSSPEFQLAWLIGQSAMSYSVASQMTDAALGGTPAPVIAAPAIQVPAPAVPAPAAPAPAELAEVYRILQQRQMQQHVPPIPESPSERSEMQGKRKSAPMTYSKSKRRRVEESSSEEEESWDLSEVSSSSASSHKSGPKSSSSSSASAGESIPHHEVRRRIPKKFQGKTRGAVSEEDVPVVDVKIAPRTRGRPRGRGRGAGARVVRAPPTPVSEAREVSPVKSEDEGELDMSKVI